MDRKIKIVIFWMLIITGFLAHSLADMMPAFWGESIAAMEGPAPAGMIAFMMLLIYLIPVTGILLVLLGKGKAAFLVNAVLACFTGLFCILHMCEWFEAFHPVQLLVMPAMALVGVLLAIGYVKLCKEK